MGTVEHHPTQEVKVEMLTGSREDIRVVKLSGPLTIHNFFDFQDLVRKERPRVLIVDLADVPYIDSAALGSLVGIHVSCEKDGRKYALVNANERLKNLFSVTGVNALLVTYTSLADAEAILAHG